MTRKKTVKKEKEVPVPKQNTVKEMMESEGEHWYRFPDGSWEPSVTTVLSVYPKGASFQKYLAGQDSWESSQEILKAAGERGSRVHKATERLEEGEVLKRADFTLEEWRMLEGFIAWHKDHKPILLKKEFILKSKSLRTGGTVDRLYQIGDDIVILDIKTSGAIYDSYWCQVAAYAYMHLEEFQDTKVDNVSILRLAPRTKIGYEYKTRHLTETMEDLFAFNACRELYDHSVKKVSPKEIEVPLTLAIEKEVIHSPND